MIQPTAVLTWPFLATFGAGIGTLFLIQYLTAYWDKPGARWFMLTLASQAIFCFAYAVGLVVFDPTARYWLEVLALIALHWIGIPFLGFALAYTGRGKLTRSRPFRGLFAIPVAITLLLPLNGYYGLFLADFEVVAVFGVAGASYAIEPLLQVSVVSGMVAAGVGALLLFDTIVSYGPLYRTEALAVALSPAPPALGLFLWLFGVGPITAINLGAVLFFAHVLLDVYAFVGSGMFQFQPATNRAAERSALADLRSPVLVLGESERVVDLNASATALLGIDRDNAITRTATDVVGEELDPEEVDRRITFQRDGKRQVFRVESAPLTDSDDNHVGYTLLFQDVTEEIQREERLSVLNRVLRHNLRNDLTVARGYATEASEQTEDPSVVALLDKADNALIDLISTGETAREIERTIGAAESYREAVDLVPLLERLATAVESSHPTASVTVEGQISRDVETNPEILESVVEQLLVNAIEHNEADKPTASVTIAERSNGSTTIAIRDDGPGIPEHELQHIQGGQETALKHGSGLGLWLVRWGTMRLGGEITFDTDDGTTVTLVLPAAAAGDRSSAGATADDGEQAIRADGSSETWTPEYESHKETS